VLVSCKLVYPSVLFVAGQSFKRCRAEAQSLSTQIELQKVLDSQAAEIQSLKSEKAGLENSFSALKGEHDRVVQENRTLKKAVLIQQERQNHSAAELDAARRYREDAEDKIKKLEQLVLSLRYHLQAQNINTPGNDFMGFPPRPPDVY
jgi:chromosome segregation ATPase